jgi:hypothetical protein
MPRLHVDPVDRVTAEILAMEWEGKNACRMWFRRRGTTPTKLGLEVVPAGDTAGGPVRVLLPEAQRGIDGSVATVAVSPPTPAQLAAFESYADRVDTMLQDAGQPAEHDDIVMGFMRAQFTPEMAVEAIFTKRRSVLPQVVRDTQSIQAAAVHRDSAPVVEETAPISAEAWSDLKSAVPETGVIPMSNPASTGVGWSAALAPGSRFFVQLGLPRDREGAIVLARAAARALGHDAFVCDARDGAGVELIEAVVRVPTVPVKKDHWGAVQPLLARPSGCSVDEAKRALGWKTAPGKWFFQKWARDAGREADLIDLGLVDMVRRFKLAA